MMTDAADAIETLTAVAERPARKASEGTNHREITKVAFASLIGTTIEWYDFYIYGTAAALIFPTLIFPKFSPGAGLLASLSTFAVGFLARPLGGVIFGHFGDRLGRKAMLVLSLVMMGLATFLVGLMPGYASVGILAPIGIVMLRFVQGVAVGGEWGGAVLMAVEHAPRNRRGFFGSWPQVGSPLGLVMATAIFAIVSALPGHQFESWGWRVPFLLSALLVAVGLVVRLTVLESPVFRQLQAEGERVRVPLAQALRHHFRNIAAAIGSFIIINSVFYLVTVLTLSWATTHLGISRKIFLDGVLIAASCMCVMIPVFGALSDRIDRRRLYAAGALFVALFAFPFYLMIATKVTALVWLGILVIMALGHTTMYGPQASLYSEMFPAKVRYTATSLSYQTGGMIGGLVPLVAQALLIKFNNAWWPLAALLTVLALVSMISVLAARPQYVNFNAEPGS